MKKYSEAIQYYSKAKEIQSSTDYSYLLLLANAYSNLGFSKEALSTASEGLKLDPQNLNFLYLRGMIYFNINDYENSAINFFTISFKP
ncbi:tetratricopeptide repeat protein [Algoriphagus boritolerans]|uniref:tetratricopeptide repeat protein n=1 Tax=Algoriphagus boritolerans TaxID=308111 RepID=UPI003A101A92